tara:strand:- start:1592 stop:2092 length:501 start_codon:yes stop_codon:yes gene_type:complete
MGKRKEGLTGKQKNFVKALIDPECRSYSDAYRLAYDTTSMNPHTIRREASKLRNHPDITTAMEKEIERAERLQIRDSIAVRKAVNNRLWAEVDSPDTPSASRIQALKLIGVEAGMFTEQKNISVSEGPMPKSRAEMLEEISDLLSTYDTDPVDNAIVVHDISKLDS